MLSNLRYHILYALWYTLSLLHLRVLYVLSDIIFVIVYYVVGYRRKVVRSNLERCFPEKDKSERKGIERRFYRFFCDYLVETLKMMSMSKEQIRRRVVFKGMEEVNRLMAEGTPIGLYLGHVGNWEWLTTIDYWMPDHMVSAHLYHPLKDKVMDRLFLRLRAKHHSVGIPMKETLRRLVMLKKQCKNFIVGYISDQNPKWQNIHHWLTFFGQETPVFTGTERIMKSTHQAFAYGDVYRVRRGYYECHIHILDPHPENVPDWQLTDRYFVELEKTIRRAPHLWLWTHKRWKRTREEFDRHFEVVNGKVRNKEKEQKND